jgi:hypothetical protein
MVVVFILINKDRWILKIVVVVMTCDMGLRPTLIHVLRAADFQKSPPKWTLDVSSSFSFFFCAYNSPHPYPPTTSAENQRFSLSKVNSPVVFAHFLSFGP